MLESTLLIKLHGVTITEEQTDLVVSDRSWEWYLMKFCADKRIENCAEDKYDRLTVEETGIIDEYMLEK